jgi:hypothetical protein
LSAPSWLGAAVYWSPGIPAAGRSLELQRRPKGAADHQSHESFDSKEQHGPKTTTVLRWAGKRGTYHVGRKSRMAASPPLFVRLPVKYW